MCVCVCLLYSCVGVLCWCCSLNGHIFNHMVYFGEIVEKEGKGQIFAALWATIGQTRISFSLCACV